MGPWARIEVLLLYLLIHLHVLAVIQHQVKHHFVDLVNQEIGTILVDLNGAGHDALVLCLIQPNRWYFIKKEFDILPPWIIHLLPKQKRKVGYFFLIGKVKYLQQVRCCLCVNFEVKLMVSNALQNVFFYLFLILQMPNPIVELNQLEYNSLVFKVKFLELQFVD